MLSCCCSVAQSCPTLCDLMECNTPGFPVLHHLLELAETHVHWVDDAVQPSHPLSTLSLAFSLSQYQGLCIRPKYWSFSFNISPSNEYSRLISFRIDWFDLLAVQGTLKSLLQHNSSKESILQHSAFFMVQLSHPYITTGKAMIRDRGTHARYGLISVGALWESEGGQFKGRVNWPPKKTHLAMRWQD